MKIIRTVEEWKKERETFKNKKIGFVPTMGGLHAGHLSLMKKCRAENEIAVASVYLNPTQFNDKKDLETYPANFDDDVKLLESAGIDYLFAPTYTVMYPDDYKYKVIETDFSKMLCGAKRPGHFDGVLTVVMKFFNIIRPTNAYFGEKDFQQYQLLKGMVEAFFLDINLIPCPIVREENGLAISSRNRKLSAEGLAKAPKLHEILAMKKSIAEKEALLTEAGFKVDYITEYKGRLYAAAFLEDVRLIDNVNA
ncbi:pantoate--beta-alanine ligase [Treponema zioleckii]|uniref:pantoate--beta-alanine ligase n=1 Tax=Treponema zioleckii TaxID=331680 RepID=UPI00168B5904|nr:pantoate--beta-alanine ligase [Treponema zioleckii]